MRVSSRVCLRPGPDAQTGFLEGRLREVQRTRLTGHPVEKSAWRAFSTGDHTVAPGLLGSVEGRVDSAQQRVALLADAQFGHAKARGYAVRQRLDRGRRDRRPDSLGGDEGEVEIQYQVFWQDRDVNYYRLFVSPTELPECSNSEVIKTLETLIRDGYPNQKIIAIESHREQRFDPETEVRYGECVMKTEEGSFDLLFSVEWQDQSKA